MQNFNITAKGRYVDILTELLNDYNAEKELRCEFGFDYDSLQGFVDITVQLSNKQIFYYKYLYGCCECCDLWEFNKLSNNEVKLAMAKGSRIFKNIKQYKQWFEKWRPND
jgi:hypothetical protein